MNILGNMVEPERNEPSHIARLPSATIYTDEQLVAGLLRRDTVVASAFFDAYGEMINGMVWRLLGADTDHDDVVHQVFIQVITSVHSLREVSTFPFWVKRVAVNTVRKEIRSRRYRRTLFMLEEAPETFGGAREDTPGDVSGRVFKVLEKMKADNHLMFALKYIEGNTHEEIAALGGCSLATAKRRVKRAREEFMKRARRDSVLGGYIEELDHE